MRVLPVASPRAGGSPNWGFLWVFWWCFFLPALLCRKKPFLFYFDIVKCASPLVLLEFQCPTTQVPAPASPLPCSASPRRGGDKPKDFPVSRHLHVFSSPIQICVSKCPDRYLTYLSAYGSRTPAELEYYRQFCVPEFKNLQKVGDGGRGGGIPRRRHSSPAALTSGIVSPPFQPPIQVLKDKECPAMIIPSTPRTSGGLTMSRLTSPLASVAPLGGSGRVAAGIFVSEGWSQASVWAFWGCIVATGRGFGLVSLGGGVGRERLRLAALSFPPPLAGRSGAAMLPGHPGQEGRHHGRQRDHLRRRPRAPEERHRAAGRGQVSSPTVPTPPWLSLCRRGAVSERWTRWGCDHSGGNLFMSFFLITAKRDWVLSAGASPPLPFTDLHGGKCQKVPAAVSPS